MEGAENEKERINNSMNLIELVKRCPKKDCF